MSEIVSVSGGPTKPEIIAVSLSKLGLKDGDRFADVGCGTGSVSIEAARIARNLTIYAIDARKEALLATETNFKNFGIENARILAGEASDILGSEKTIDSIDCALLEGRKHWHLRSLLRKSPTLLNAVTSKPLSGRLRL